MQMAEVVMAQAKSKLISQVVKKNMVENVIPVIIALKHMVSEKHCLTSRDFMPLAFEGGPKAICFWVVYSSIGTQILLA